MEDKANQDGKVYYSRPTKEQLEARSVPLWVWALTVFGLYWFIIRWVISLI